VQVDDEASKRPSLRRVVVKRTTSCTSSREARPSAQSAVECSRAYPLRRAGTNHSERNVRIWSLWAGELARRCGWRVARMPYSRRGRWFHHQRFMRNLVPAYWVLQQQLLPHGSITRPGIRFAHRRFGPRTGPRTGSPISRPKVSSRSHPDGGETSTTLLTGAAGIRRLLHVAAVATAC
jgi:hypothetical protein